MKKSERTLTPKLRFLEFREKPGWDALKLGDVASFHKGQGLPKSAIAPTGKHPCIHYGQLFTEYSEVIDVIISRTDSDISGLRSQVNDVLMPTSDVTPNGLAKACCIKIGAVILGGDILVIRTNTERVKGEFLARQIRQRERQVLQLVSGSTVFHLYASSLDKLSVSLPSPPEQQKIADCLSSLDGLIAAEGRMLETLKAHKKGLMQQLFPQPGQTQPRLRFPEFLDKEEWVEKKIEDYFSVRSSKRVLQKDWTTQGIPFYRTRELVSLYNNEPFSSEIFISEELFSEISQKYGLPTEGDILVSGVGTLGISYQVRAGDKFYFKDGNVLWFKKKSGIVSTFFKYCFQSGQIQDQILGQASISTVGTYTIQNAKVTKFLCPPIKTEQKKIADCLTALDTRITVQAAKIDALKQHKRGLMQQLFPAPEDNES